MHRMSIAAANTVPNFLLRRQISVSDLPRISEPCVVFEYEGADSDGVPFWAYTIGGWLDGQPLGDHRGGVTVKGEVAIITGAMNRQHADWLACEGLQTTIDAEIAATRKEMDARKALERLSSVGVIERMNLATRPDKSDAFVEDVDAVRPLVGDDIVLAAGHVKH